jgi:transposase-like protein
VQLTGPDGLLTGLTRRVLETALEVERTEHLGHEPGERAVSGNVRNGRTRKAVRTGAGPVRITVPRDRQATFEPQVVPQHARRLEGFNEAIVSQYAKGLTTGDIQAQLRELYGAEVPRELISQVTDAVVDELVEWQNRPLDRVYPVLIDCIPVLSSRSSRTVGRASPVPLVAGGIIPPTRPWCPRSTWSRQQG